MKFRIIQGVVAVLLLFNIEVCGQKNKNSDNDDLLERNFKFLIGIDMYRNTVADSLKHLIPILDSIYMDDQKYRYGMYSNPLGETAKAEAQKNFGQHKAEGMHLDSINLRKVIVILDKYGWLTPKEIGRQESIAIFLVIQHADLKTQEKYLPLLRKVVLDKKDLPYNLIMLEDRVSVGKYKFQIYGTQVFYNQKRKRFFLFPITEPEKLLERRKSIGLDSLSLQKYLQQFKLNWDLETYKKEQPEIKAYQHFIGN